MINKEDLSELQRLVTNTYDDDKKFLQRIIVGITQMDQKITQLKAEVARLKKD
jgi:uncharacterized small protein (DUF1192 family)